MAAPKRYWRGHCEFPLTEEYERGHESTFKQRADRYCKGCGRLPHYCECQCPAHGNLRVPGCAECAERITPTARRPGEQFTC